MKKNLTDILKEAILTEEAQNISGVYDDRVNKNHKQNAESLERAREANKDSAFEKSFKFAGISSAFQMAQNEVNEWKVGAFINGRGLINKLTLSCKILTPHDIRSYKTMGTEEKITVADEKNQTEEIDIFEDDCCPNSEVSNIIPFAGTSDTFTREDLNRFYDPEIDYRKKRFMDEGGLEIDEKYIKDLMQFDKFLVLLNVNVSVLRPDFSDIPNLGTTTVQIIQNIIKNVSDIYEREHEEELGIKILFPNKQTLSDGNAFWQCCAQFLYQNANLVFTYKIPIYLLVTA